MVASEVSDAPRTFPRALTAALVLTTVTYALPLAACTAAVPPSSWPEWGEGQFEIVAKQVGGPLLQYILLATSVTAEVGVLCTLMCTTSRALVAMAQLRMLPGPLARLHPSLGTPYLAIALNSALIALATTLLHLEALLEITMFFYAVNVIVQCATILRLRRTHPHRLRPSYTLPAPLLALPALCALLLLVLTPARGWLAALSLFLACLLLYVIIHLVRLAQGHKPAAPPSARATAAVEALAVVVPPFNPSAHDNVHEADGVCGDGRSSRAAPRHAGYTRHAGHTRHAGQGDAWFARLTQRYRPLSDREQEMQRAEGQLQGFEMSPRDREEWDAARDRGDEEDEDEAGGGRGTDEGAPSPELPLTYDSTYEHDDSPRESPKGTAPPTSSRAGAVAGATKRAAAKRVTISADEGLAQCRSSRAAAPAPGADVPAASGISSGAGEVSASEAARMLAAEREKGTTSGGRVATASADEFVDIIE